MTVLGSLPYLIVIPGSVTFGNAVEKFAHQAKLNPKKDLDLSFKCLKGGEEDKAADQFITSVRYITYLDSGQKDKNISVNLTAVPMFKDQKCINKTKCDFKRTVFAKQIKDWNKVKTMEVKLSCLKIPTEKTYNTICALFTFLNPLCLAVFLTYTDRLLDFFKRFINQFQLKSIQVKDFSIQVGNIPNVQFIQEYMAKFNPKKTTLT